MAARCCRITKSKISFRLYLKSTKDSTQRICHSTLVIVPYKIGHPDQVIHLDFAYIQQREMSITRRNSQEEARLAAAPTLGLPDWGCKNSYKAETTRKPSNTIKNISVPEIHKLFIYLFIYLGYMHVNIHKIKLFQNTSSQSFTLSDFIYTW